MPEEFDNSNVKVVDSVPAEDSSDSSSSSNSNNSSSSSNDSGADVVLTDVVGEDGYRKTQSQLEEDLASGNTENLKPAPQSSQSAVEGSVENINEQNPDLDREAPSQRERNRQTFTEDIATTTEGERQADVNLSGVQTSDGRQLTEREVRQRIQEGRTQDIEPGPGMRTSTSAKIESRRNRRENILETRREERQELRQRSSIPGVDPENIVVGSRQDPIEGAARDFFNPNRKVDGDLDTWAEEAVIAGQDIIRESQEFGENVEEKTPDWLGSGPGSIIASAELAGRGEFGEATESLFLPGNQNELERKRSEEIVSGAASGPGTLAGFALGGLSATGIAAGNDISRALGTETDGPGVVESIQGGGSKIIEQASEDPGSFAAGEFGEEIGEGAARAALTGGIGAFAVTPNVEPTLTFQTPERAQTAGRFVTGDLGVRAEDPNVLGQTEDLALIERRTEETGEGGRRQIVQGFTEQSLGEGESVLFGERTETPITRREYLKEVVGLSDAELADALPDLNTKRKGQLFLGQRVRRPSTQPETPETEPNIDIDGEKLFQETPEPETTPLPEEVSVRTSRLMPGLEADVEASSESLDQGLGLNQDLIGEQEIDQEQEIGIDNAIENIVEPETTQERTRIDRIFEPRVDRRPETSRSLFGSDSEEDPEQNSGSQEDINSEFEFEASVGAEILGITAEEAPSREEVQDPFSLRPVVEEDNQQEEDLFNL